MKPYHWTNITVYSAETASDQGLGDILRRPRVTMEQQEAKYLPENKDVTYWYFYNPVCCLRSHCRLWQDSTRLNRFICTVHGVDHICGMMEEQWGPLPHQKYVGWRCPIYFCEETQTIRCYMTGLKLCSPGEFIRPKSVCGVTG